ncbi:FMN-binding negative transcriptional regulator [Chitinophaga sp. S165]|uniref:FMN-binding negative transcriptional regulator n=1 Tax=Chitinophaga sp. S165 TaxID=2135462 RepID=UPI000D7191B3|nr:FMN-binding negative transcriptional regulator [Chitinophaga sp. S165]PWV48903.1 PaiB family negative transcriptional regulator [Chitinophaga sp. S165]
MYTPKGFEFDNEADKIAFMKQYSFATIINAINGVPVATQLPFVVDDSAGKLLISSHFALANEQAGNIGENTSLVIFTGPHGYISPSHYDKWESVPTWDYMAVHAYGKARIVHDESGKMKILEQMIGYYEQDYLKQWNDLPEKYKKGMLRGIVAFELEVTNLQGQKKLSQNKSSEERKRIIAHLKDSNDPVENSLAAYIQKTL